jgi:hypothetical protein
MNRKQERKVPVVCIEQRLYAHLCYYKRRKNARVYRILVSPMKSEHPGNYLSVHFAVRDLVGEGANITFVHVLSVWFKCCSWLRNDRVASAISTRSDVCTVERGRTVPA